MKRSITQKELNKYIMHFKSEKFEDLVLYFAEKCKESYDLKDNENYDLNINCLYYLNELSHEDILNWNEEADWINSSKLFEN